MPPTSFILEENFQNLSGWGIFLVVCLDAVCFKQELVEAIQIFGKLKVVLMVECT